MKYIIEFTDDWHNVIDATLKPEYKKGEMIKCNYQTVMEFAMMLIHISNFNCLPTFKVYKIKLFAEL